RGDVVARGRRGAGTSWRGDVVARGRRGAGTSWRGDVVPAQAVATARLAASHHRSRWSLHQTGRPDQDT
ncbi:hypothetical protein, partial [Nonomuraea sp. NPDC050783]|uniref:hypothetical protein n=1 Tax=Nonomuraea sp. NPDC050783 TaxID=3154634 RepID=UPI0034666154